MQKCPEVYSLKGADVQQRIDHLRKMGLVEGDASCPLVYYNAVLKFGVSKIFLIFLRDIDTYIWLNCLKILFQINTVLFNCIFYKQSWKKEYHGFHKNINQQHNCF